MRVFVWLVAVAVVATSQAATVPSYDIAVFATGESGKGIYVMRGDGSDPKLVRAEANALLMDGSWSPDGKRIAYSAFGPEDEALLTKFSLPLHFPLYVMNADGTGRERLLDVPVEPFIQWSPDGLLIFFSSGFEDPARDNPRVQRGLEAGSVAIYSADIQSRKITRLTPLGQNRFLSVSPDGLHVAFSGKVEASNQDIYVVDTDSRNLRRLTTTPTPDMRPQWSPKGDLIAYVAAVAGPSWVFVMKPDGSAAKQISTSRVASVQWSPDGTHLLVGAELVNVATGATTGQLPRVGLDPAFAPDGQAVIYRTADEGNAQSWSIFSVDLKGQDAKKIASAATAFSVSPMKK